MLIVKLNFEFAPPKRVVGMYKYLVSCALELSASQLDPLKEVFPCADVEYGLDNFYDLESFGLRKKGLRMSLNRFKILVTPSLFKMDTIMFICQGIKI